MPNTGVGLFRNACGKDSNPRLTFQFKEFNSNAYFKAHTANLGGKRTNAWGGHELQLGQFLTMYPHTDDNTFLGFVVETYDFEENIPRENITVVYGKEAYMWKVSPKTPKHHVYRTPKSS